MAILLSKNIAQCDDRARPRGVTTARRSVELGLVEILSWMRHWLSPLCNGGVSLSFGVCHYLKGSVIMSWGSALSESLVIWLQDE